MLCMLELYEELQGNTTEPRLEQSKQFWLDPHARPPVTHTDAPIPLQSVTSQLTDDRHFKQHTARKVRRHSEARRVAI